MQVSEFTVMATTKCKKHFACLEGNQDCLCEIEVSNGSHTVAVKPNGNKGCNYMFHINGSAYCLCPTRNELYNCYQV
jgi:hypothetical protein